jgi:hypothetical protein
MYIENIQQALHSLESDSTTLTLQFEQTSINLFRGKPSYDSNYWIFVTDMQPIGLSSLSEISGFVPGVDLANLNFLPSEIPISGGLVLSTLELLVSKPTEESENAKELEGLAVVVGLGNPWTLIPNIFSFEQLNIMFLNGNPTKPEERYVECNVFGTIALGKSDIRLDASLTSCYSLTAELPAGSEIDIGSILAHLLPGAEVPPLKIAALIMNLDFDCQTYDMTITVIESWELLDFGSSKLELNYFTLSIRYIGGSPSSITGEIIAAFNIAGLDIQQIAGL